MPRQAVGWVRGVGGASRSRRCRHPPPRPSEHPSRRAPLITASNQVREMLQCAAKEVDRSPRHLNYTELRALATERGLSRQLGKILERSAPEKKRKTRKLSKCGASGRVEHEVFLGGSCNPTTWRQDTAIPLLDSLGISYYNPQVGEWSCELVAVERRAKETARVLLYVLDRSTRNVVGMVEAAEFAATRGARLVLVLDQYLCGQPIAGETISHREFEELCGGLATLKELVERQGIPVFHSITQAINSTAKLLSEHGKFGMNKVHSLPDKLDQVQVGDKYFALREAFNALDTTSTGEISLKDCCMAYERLTNKTLSINDLKEILDTTQVRDYDSNVTINFDQFCTLVNKLRLRNGSTQKWSSCCSGLQGAVATPLDLYISSSDSGSWRDTLAAPLLQSSGLKYRLSEPGPGSSFSKEADLMDSARTLLFIVSSSTRGLDTMTLASYYIGLGSSVVLCIQELKEGSAIESELLSKVAAADYNRGRVYLTDEARRRGVPVLASIEEALRAAVDTASQPPS